MVSWEWLNLAFLPAPLGNQFEGLKQWTVMEFFKNTKQYATTTLKSLICSAVLDGVGLKAGGGQPSAIVYQSRKWGRRDHLPTCFNSPVACEWTSNATAPHWPPHWPHMERGESMLVSAAQCFFLPAQNTDLQDCHRSRTPKPDRPFLLFIGLGGHLSIVVSLGVSERQ